MGRPLFVSAADRENLMGLVAPKPVHTGVPTAYPSTAGSARALSRARWLAMVLILIIGIVSTVLLLSQGDPGVGMAP